MRRKAGLLALVAVVVFAALIAAGVTDGFGSGALLRTNVGGPMPDGAAHGTFWDAQVVDVPGLTVTAVHCHGAVQYELQIGATAPSSDNACYAAMGSYAGESLQWGVYAMLPGDRAVYRISENYRPWRYCIAGLRTPSPTPLSSGPAGLPC